MGCIAGVLGICYVTAEIREIQPQLIYHLSIRTHPHHQKECYPQVPLAIAGNGQCHISAI